MTNKSINNNFLWFVKSIFLDCIAQSTIFCAAISYFDIKFDTARCKECGLEEIVLQLFGEAKDLKNGSHIYHVVDVEQYVEECKEKKDN